MSALDGDFILRYLLINREKFAKDKLIIDDNHYKVKLIKYILKFKCTKTDADGNQIDFTIQLK
jgi:hypothetical protein